MVLVQKWPFFQLFFLGNIGREHVFYDILERKNAFLGLKNKKFKKSKNWHFFNGVTVLQNCCLPFVHNRLYLLALALFILCVLENIVSVQSYSTALILVCPQCTLIFFYQAFMSPNSRYMARHLGFSRERKNAFLGHKNKKFKKSKKLTFFHTG